MPNRIQWWSSVALLTALLLAVGALAACDGSGDEAPDGSEGTIEVVASTPIIAEWVARVGGERVKVVALVRSGADAHTLQLSPRNVTAIAEADLIVINGAGLEAAYRGTIDANARAQVLELADEVDLEPFSAGPASEEAADPGGAAAKDPHFWLDPERALDAIHGIRDALIALLPRAAEELAANASAYTAEIEAADGEVRAALAVVPREQRVLVTFHDAYGYFGRRYDVELLGFVVEGPEQDASAAEIAALIEQMQERGLTRVYREPQFNSDLVDRIAAETGAEVRTIYSQPFGEVSTYVELLQANAQAIAES